MDELYKVGIFADFDGYAVTLTRQKLGDENQSIASIEYSNEISFNAIERIAQSSEKYFEVRKNHFFVNRIDYLVEKLEESGIEAKAEELDEMSVVTVIKSLLNDEKLNFDTPDITKQVEKELKNFAPGKVNHVLNSIYLSCCHNAKKSGFELWRDICHKRRQNMF
ncbi:MAG: hypothetical protein AAF383_23375 [Cyanobacteria bacterium P01_A01_bin.83]